MKEGWKTHAIGRHLVDLPGDARTSESYRINRDEIELLSASDTSRLAVLVGERELLLRQTIRSVRREPMFIERIQHPNDAVTIVTWASEHSDALYHFDTYFKAGSRALRYSGDVSLDKKSSILSFLGQLAGEWREIPPKVPPQGVGFIAGEVILVDQRFNLESWRMAIHLAGKPDVSFKVTAYTQRSVEPGLRKRGGGVLAGLLSTVAGFTQLRNRERPVGPIEADEILVAGTQDGKRSYGFKWEAPGKADSLAEPNLNVSLQVGESAYLTNKESFASDEEALELWDAVVGSLRLRPGAV
ncbi:T6SS immunity protein Tli4 family protein [Cupriavidus necator]|uniref:T6SS immunity protein Tli4 family protein n=1 Tax=Cupriavidus necator TaxID=106590 RepID=UPI0039C188F9